MRLSKHARNASASTTTPNPMWELVCECDLRSAPPQGPWTFDDAPTFLGRGADPIPRASDHAGMACARRSRTVAMPRQEVWNRGCGARSSGNAHYAMLSSCSLTSNGTYPKLCGG